MQEICLLFQHTFDSILGWHQNKSKTCILSEQQLATAAKKFRIKAGISKAEAARQLGVIRGTVQQAEEYPKLSLTKLRIKMIENILHSKSKGRCLNSKSND